MRNVIVISFLGAVGMMQAGNLLPGGNFECAEAVRNTRLETKLVHSGTASLAIVYDMYMFPELILLDPSKTYRLSGWFRSLAADKPSGIILTIRYYDSAKRPITPWSVQPAGSSLSTLASGAKVGDRQVLVKHSDWKTVGDPSPGSLVIAFDAREDESDLPNLSAIPLTDIQEQGDVYRISLVQPLGADYPVGTKVRQHRYRDYPWAYDKDSPLGTDWRQYSLTVGPRAVPGNAVQNFLWKGAVYARVAILTRNMKRENGPVLLADDIRLEIVD